MVETHLTNSVPGDNWQQAGIILSEDSTFKSKMLRVSIAYNDFFGGYPKPAEIIIQIIGSSESGMLSKPEEIAHIPLFTIEPGKEELAQNNLAKSDLKLKRTERISGFFTLHHLLKVSLKMKRLAETSTYIPGM